ncbi:hypothetical protein [Halorussus caseinilyticus]|uniref:hypothetical protein n=1 Tax=Halorussus caseinilyticus TaxID=3034025 RepID=UPI0023E88FEF|nr:hypothetical protein [Halorussus sp. DT72]
MSTTELTYEFPSGRRFSIGAVAGFLAFVVDYAVGSVDLLGFVFPFGSYSVTSFLILVACSAVALYASGPPTVTGGAAVAASVAAVNGVLSLVLTVFTLLTNGLPLSFIASEGLVPAFFIFPLVAGVVGVALAYKLISAGIVSPRNPVGGATRGESSPSSVGSRGIPETSENDRGTPEDDTTASGRTDESDGPTDLPRDVAGGSPTGDVIDADLGLDGTITVTSALNRAVRCRIACRTAAGGVVVRQEIVVRPDSDQTWTGIPPATEVKVGLKVESGPSAAQTFENAGATAVDPTIALRPSGIEITAADGGVRS